MWFLQKNHKNKTVFSFFAVVSLFSFLQEVIMARNFGIGTRDLADAGRRFLAQKVAQKNLSFASGATLAARWRQFAAYAKAHGVGSLTTVTPDLVRAYARELSEKVAAGEMKPAYAQNLVSATNTVMRATPAQWQNVHPVTDCGMSKRSFVRTTTPGGLDPERFAAARAALLAQENARGAALADLARHLGLRSKETALLDARKALQEAVQRGQITVILGTKGGQTRIVPITSQKQIEALREASKVQGRQYNILPQQMSLKDWQKPLEQIRDTIRDATGQGIHDLRAAYACERYRQLTGHDAPVVAGRMLASRAVDYAARLRISEELGHHRIDVVSSYIGGRA
ncbi:MAG: integrase domain-containing protein [Phycisphaerae bacterium]